MKVNVLKSLVLVLMSSFIGIMANPELLMASDTVAVSGIDDSRAVETVIPEPEIEEPVVKEVAPLVSESRAGAAQAASSVQVRTVKQETQPVQVAPANNVAFSWGTQELFVASSTAVNSGAKVARVGKLMWGHNYTAFGNITNIKKLAVGSTFKVTENGRTTTYRVAVNPINGAAGVVLDKKSDAVLSYAGDARYSNIDMNALVNYGMGHSLVLLTCYGSNSRYVVVADAV